MNLPVRLNPKGKWYSKGGVAHPDQGRGWVDGCGLGVLNPKRLSETIPPYSISIFSCVWHEHVGLLTKYTCAGTPSVVYLGVYLDEVNRERSMVRWGSTCPTFITVTNKTSARTRDTPESTVSSGRRQPIGPVGLPVLDLGGSPRKHRSPPATAPLLWRYTDTPTQEAPRRVRSFGSPPVQ